MSIVRTPRLDARLTLALVKGVGPIRLAALEASLGSPEAIIVASAAALQSVDGIGPKLARDIRAGIEAVDLDEQWSLIESHQASLIAIDDEQYPTLLKHIQDPPPLLFVQGRLKRQDTLAIAVVGARKCTRYGMEQAERFASACAEAGLTIISGGARGIDTAAHRGALRVRGRTLVVTGCGLSHCYPPENAELFQQIIADDAGAMISEFPMHFAPIAENFPRRNRIVSGLSLGTLVIEAGARSGALITARLAAEDHGREVMAVPGRVDSQASSGCHKIIREGWATLVTNATDLLDALGETGRTLKAAVAESDQSSHADPLLEPDAASTNPLITALSESQRKIYDTLDRDAMSFDQLVNDSGLPVHIIQSQLTILQVRGLVEKLPGNRLRRRS